MSPIKAKASSLAPGMRLFKGCLSCLGNLNPTCDANLYPSAHSSFVGVPFMDLIIMPEKNDIKTHYSTNFMNLIGFRSSWKQRRKSVQFCHDGTNCKNINRRIVIW